MGLNGIRMGLEWDLMRYIYIYNQP
jgi:hypothetical protein